jgi:hypothetical protein
MFRVLIFALVIIIAGAPAGYSAEQREAEIVTPYFGLSMPVPDTLPNLALENKKGVRLLNKEFIAVLAVDDGGQVREVEYDADMTDYMKPLVKGLKKISFQFTEGYSLDFPLRVPFEIKFSGVVGGGKKARLKFPLAPDTTSDAALLETYFKQNDVDPPGVIDIPPIFYRVEPQSDDAEYLTITARVFLDESGQLRDIRYPIPGQDIMTHAVQMGLMNARYAPARIKGRPTAADFLLTFRIFDNLKYPFSPLRQADTAEIEPITAGYFMTRYFNTVDMGIPALPRTHGYGYIHTAPLAHRRTGTAEADLRIDTVGAVRGVSVVRASPGLTEIIAPVVKLIGWYPARDRMGRPEPFAGRILLKFEAAPKVVYNAEWLAP